MTPLGSIKPDKSIVRVWIKVKEWIVLEQVSCSQLEIEPIDSRDTKLRYMPPQTVDEELEALNRGLIPKPYHPSKERIIPGSWAEKLYNEVCK